MSLSLLDGRLALPPRLPMSVGLSLRDKTTQSLRETPTSTALPPFAALAALCRLSRQCFSQILQQSIEHFVRAASSVKLPQQPGAPRRGHPDTLHGDFGRAALEVELEEGFRSEA